MTLEFKSIMEQILKNSKALAAELAKLGFRVVSGGTDNHMVLLDLRPKKITGKLFQDSLEYVGITINKNMIPFDPEKPSVTSGVRIGLTSVSQRGFKEPEIARIAEIMNKVARSPEDRVTLDKCKAEALLLISKFPLYPDRNN
jgi:glycine hydroxymethyltransferase